MSQNGENSTGQSEESESSDHNEVNEQWITLFKSFSKLMQSISYSAAYFTISLYILNKISGRYFQKYNISFHWNIYQLISNKI